MEHLYLTRKQWDILTLLNKRNSFFTCLSDPCFKPYDKKKIALALGYYQYSECTEDQKREILKTYRFYIDGNRLYCARYDGIKDII